MTSSMTQSPVTTAVADGNAATPVHRISVCICTLKRPELLRRTLAKLEKQITEGLFTFSIVVADNDSMRSAQPAVAEFSSAAHVSASYCREPERNSAMARNKAVQNSD
jgi:succinoglycan biosynthesis protein ExoM